MLVGDFLGGWLVLLLALEIAGYALFAEYVVNFSLAFGIAVQYFAIVPMRGLGRREGLVAALKADTASLTALVLGFATAYPVNGWLIRAGIKEAM